MTVWSLRNADGSSPRLPLFRSAARVGAALLALMAAAACQTASSAGEKRGAGGWTQKTAWGHPDLQGVWENYDEIGIPVEKPAGDVRIIETQEEAFEVADARGGATGAGPGWWYEVRPTRNPARTHSLLDPPDGKLPPLTAAAQARADASRGGQADSYESLDTWDRCLAISAIPTLGAGQYNRGWRLVQTSDAVIIHYEQIHDLRVIPLDGRPHLGPDIRLWQGDPRGRWEGDTLVVETTNFNGKTTVHGRRPASPALRLIERFRRIDADNLQYQVTIEDPGVSARPHTIASPFRRDDNHKIFEYACHEGNQAVVNVLTAARAEERRTGGGAR